MQPLRMDSAMTLDIKRLRELHAATTHYKVWRAMAVITAREAVRPRDKQ